MIKQNETGYLFQPGDAAELADNVIFHFSRPAFARRTMRRQCAAQAAAHT